MKRFILVVIAAVIAAFAIAYALRNARRSSAAAVFSLVPAETLAIAVMPDVRRTRDEWHGTDIYKLWREPAVQEFLQKPLATLPKNGGASGTVAELDGVGATNVFIALTGIKSSAWRLVGGFRFSGKQQDAQKIIDDCRTRLIGGATEAKSETTEHRGRQIRTDSAGIVRVSSVFDGDWFLAANDIDELKLLIDRVDGKAGENGPTLVAEETFVGARRQMPAQYATLLYVRAAELAAALKDSDPAIGARVEALHGLRSLCIAGRIDGGRIRETIFAGMPKSFDAELTRTGLQIGSKETWLYVDALADLASALVQPNATSGILQPWARVISESGITAEDWSSAFSSEIATIGDWRVDSRWPTLVASVPVKDAARAKQLGDKLATGTAGAGWTSREENGVRYFELPAPGRMFAISPTIALSDRAVIAGFGFESVRDAIGRVAAGKPGLDAVQDFKTASATLPPPKQAFGYVDTALLYTRLDAALRPMLLMGAAFVPAIRDTIDLSKLPPPEVITSHLSPVVFSQRYGSDGYIAESIGPVTFTQLVAGIAAVATGGALFYQRHAPNWSLPAVPLPNVTSPASGVRSPTPTPTPTPF